jgi:hypothetical protein
MRRAAALLIVVAACVLLVPAGAQARKRCGTVSANHITVKVVVWRGKVSCHGARRVARRNFLYAGRAVRGWFCFTAHGHSSYAGVCAPNGHDPDTARRVIRIYGT